MPSNRLAGVRLLEPGDGARVELEFGGLDSIDRSLSRLGVDYVDLYQIHRFDYETPIEETLEALNDVVRAGKALYVGASSMFAWQFARMLDIARAKGHAQFVSMQTTTTSSIARKSAR